MTSIEVKPTRRAAEKIYEWCKKKYGRSKYNGKYPTLYFRKADQFTGDAWAIYDCDDNYIHINKERIENVENLASTIIHEYTHYMQNIRVDYMVLAKYFDPSTENHPLEKEAEEVANRDYKECLREVFGIITE
jgi:hypothetical protein